MNKLKTLNINFILLITIVFFLSGCASRVKPAPVVNGWQHPMTSTGEYKVSKGETLYSIAFKYGLDYQQLAALNHISAPYDIYPGQQLRLKGVAKKSTVEKPKGQKVVKTTVTPEKNQTSAVATATTKSQPVEKVTQKQTVVTKQTTKSTPKRTQSTKATQEKYPSRITWYWPVQGKVIQGYSASNDGNKGLDIAGYSGQPIRAAAAGKVVYAGNGIRGYGNLVIIKNNSAYLSAYAHSSRILVKEGQWVKAKQKIALMGDSGANRVMLHFEIRRYGKPINPSRLLKKG